MAGRSAGRASKKPRMDEEDHSDSDTRELEENVERCVRYLLYASSGNTVIKKSEIVKNALRGSGKSFDMVIKEAAKHLDKIYGLKLVTFEDGTMKYYVLVNKMDHIDTENDHDSSDSNKILTMLVLTHIFMCNNVVNEVSMVSFLSSLDIDINKKHNFFGDVKEFINSTLVKQKFLKLNVDSVTRKSSYTWGARAEATISKKKILEFVCKVYSSKRDLQPSAWETQYKEVQQQELAVDEENQNGI